MSAGITKVVKKTNAVSMYLYAGGIDRKKWEFRLVSTSKA